MKKLHIIVSALLFALAVRTVSADVVETKDGARLVGKVTQIDGTTVVLETDYAGTVKVKQADVTTITTDTPSNIRLASGTVLQGTLSGKGEGVETIMGPDGSIQTTVSKVITIWAPTAKDPEIVALQRAWAYDAAVDIAGKTGNTSQYGTALSFRATLNGPTDKLQFYTGYNHQVTEGEASADQFKAGIDFQSNFSKRTSWYLRDEAGFDRIKLIDFQNVAAAGLGYDFLKKPKWEFTGRLGLAHRFESYRMDPLTLLTKEDVNSAGLDVGLFHSIELKSFTMVNRISYVPAFNDFSDFRFFHESYIQLPLQSPMWKLRLGLTNDYTSKPAVGLKEMDTTYYTRLVLNWK
jgi:hypothetical protein